MSLVVPSNVRALEPMINKFLPFAQERLGYSDAPSIRLAKDPENAKNPLGKTAYYEPDSKMITVYIDGRHPKDIMRSISHELVHHAQNMRGDLAGTQDMGEQGYAQNNDHLREMEREAYEQGNLCFRDWEDGIKSENPHMYESLKRNLKESQFAATASEEAQKINAEAGIHLNTEQEYWERVGVRTGEELAIEILTGTYSDMFKSIHNIRPRRSFSSVEEVQAAIERLDGEMEAAIEQQKLDAQAEEDYRKNQELIASLMPNEMDVEYEKMPKRSGMGRAAMQEELNMFERRNIKLNNRLMEKFGYKLTESYAGPKQGDDVRIIGGALTGAEGEVMELTTTTQGHPALVVYLRKDADKRIYGAAGDEVIVQPKFVEVDRGIQDYDDSDNPEDDYNWVGHRAHYQEGKYRSGEDTIYPDQHNHNLDMAQDSWEAANAQAKEDLRNGTVDQEKLKYDEEYREAIEAQKGMMQEGGSMEDLGAINEFFGMFGDSDEVKSLNGAAEKIAVEEENYRAAKAEIAEKVKAYKEPGPAIAKLESSIKRIKSVLETYSSLASKMDEKDFKDHKTHKVVKKIRQDSDVVMNLTSVSAQETVEAAESVVKELTRKAKLAVQYAQQDMADKDTRSGTASYTRNNSDNEFARGMFGTDDPMDVHRESQGGQVREAHNNVIDGEKPERMWASIVDNTPMRRDGAIAADKLIAAVAEENPDISPEEIQAFLDALVKQKSIRRNSDEDFGDEYQMMSESRPNFMGSDEEKEMMSKMSAKDHYKYVTQDRGRREMSPDEINAIESFNNWRKADPVREQDWEPAQVYRNGRILAYHIKDSSTIDPVTGRAKIIQKHYDVSTDMYVDDEDLNAILPEAKLKVALKARLTEVFAKYPQLASNKDFINTIKEGVKSKIMEKQNMKKLNKDFGTLVAEGVVDKLKERWGEDEFGSMFDSYDDDEDEMGLEPSPEEEEIEALLKQYGLSKDTGPAADAEAGAAAMADMEDDADLGRRPEEDEEDLGENMGDYYDPRQSGGHHDQPKTSNMKLKRQCKEGDKKACEMLKQRMGENMGDYYDPRQSGGHSDQPKTSNMKLKRQCKEGDEKACEMLKQRMGATVMKEDDGEYAHLGIKTTQDQYGPLHVLPNVQFTGDIAADIKQIQQNDELDSWLWGELGSDESITDAAGKIVYSGADVQDHVGAEADYDGSYQPRMAEGTDGMSVEQFADAFDLSPSSDQNGQVVFYAVDDGGIKAQEIHTQAQRSGFDVESDNDGQMVIYTHEYPRGQTDMDETHDHGWSDKRNTRLNEALMKWAIK